MPDNGEKKGLYSVNVGRIVVSPELLRRIIFNHRIDRASLRVAGMKVFDHRESAIIAAADFSMGDLPFEKLVEAFCGPAHVEVMQERLGGEYLNLRPFKNEEGDLEPWYILSLLQLPGFFRLTHDKPCWHLRRIGQSVEEMDEWVAITGNDGRYLQFWLPEQECGRRGGRMVTLSTTRELSLEGLSDWLI